MDKQAQIIADIRAYRRQLFKLCTQYVRLIKQNKRKEAAGLTRQIVKLTSFLKKVEAAALT